MVVGMAACASAPRIAMTPEACEAPAEGLIVRSGRLERDHGDRLVRKPTKDDPEWAYLIVRDETYDRMFPALAGKQVQLLLRPVGACDIEGGSSQAACYWSGGGGMAHRVAAYCRVES